MLNVLCRWKLYSIVFHAPQKKLMCNYLFIVVWNLWRIQSRQHCYPNRQHLYPHPDRRCPTCMSSSVAGVVVVAEACDWHIPSPAGDADADDRISRWIRSAIGPQWMHLPQPLRQRPPPRVTQSMCPSDSRISSCPDCTLDAWICNGCVNCRCGCM